MTRKISIQVSDDPMYKLIPLAMRVPNELGIYALSALEQPKLLSWYEFTSRYTSVEALVSLEPDGISNPQKMDIYGFGWDCWYLVEFTPVSQDTP